MSNTKVNPEDTGNPSNTNQGPSSARSLRFPGAQDGSFERNSMITRYKRICHKKDLPLIPARRIPARSSLYSLPSFSRLGSLNYQTPKLTLRPVAMCPPREPREPSSPDTDDNSSPLSTPTSERAPSPASLAYNGNYEGDATMFTPVPKNNNARAERCGDHADNPDNAEPEEDRARLEEDDGNIEVGETPVAMRQEDQDDWQMAICRFMLRFMAAERVATLMAHLDAAYERPWVRRICQALCSVYMCLLVSWDAFVAFLSPAKSWVCEALITLRGWSRKVLWIMTTAKFGHPQYFALVAILTPVLMALALAGLALSGFIFASNWLIGLYQQKKKKKRAPRRISLIPIQVEENAEDGLF